MNAKDILEFIRKKQKQGVKYILLDCGREGMYKKDIEYSLGNLRKVTPQANNTLVFATSSGDYRLNANAVLEIWGLVK